MIAAFIFLTLLNSPPPVLPPEVTPQHEDPEHSPQNMDDATIPRQVEAYDTNTEKPPRETSTRDVPPVPDTIKARENSMLWSTGFHWLVQFGLTTTLGATYSAPSQDDIPSPPDLMADVTVGMLYKFAFWPRLSLGFDLSVRTASPLPVMHAGIDFTTDWAPWAFSLYVRESELGSSNPSKSYESKGHSIGAGIWYALPFRLRIGSIFLFGVTWEYWSGTHFSGDESHYTDGPGTFTHKQLIMSLRLTR